MIRAVGRNVVRKDGAAKAAGTARYVDDLTPDVLGRAGLVWEHVLVGFVLDFFEVFFFPI